jgi:hypothetical protein
MSTSDFLLDYLPSFYRNFMIDENGNNLLTPIFDIYCNAMSDVIFQGQQISLVPYLENCDPIFIELYSTIDVTENNKYLDGYIIDSNIIKLEDLYLDAIFTKPILGTCWIKYNISKNIRYAVFSTELPLTQSTIFVKKVYRDKEVLSNIWGNLIDYKKPPFYANDTDGMTIDYSNIKDYLDQYKNELLALFYGSLNGPSVKTLYNGLGIFLGLKYATFDSIVTAISNSSITLESQDRTQTYTITCTTKPGISIGDEFSKYDLIEKAHFLFIDIVKDPAIFTQIILSNYGEKYLSLLNIDIANGEKYAHLTYDSTISFDGDMIYWDMGDGTGNSTSLSGTTLVEFYDPEGANQNRFDDWISPLFENQKFYEMFKNLFIVHTSYDDSTIIKIKYYLDKIKPIWTKYIIANGNI